MSWRKEKHEHPWATKAQAKRIARDHAKQKHSKQPKPKSKVFQTAKTDYTKLYNQANQNIKK